MTLKWDTRVSCMVYMEITYYLKTVVEPLNWKVFWCLSWIIILTPKKSLRSKVFFVRNAISRITFTHKNVFRFPSNCLIFWKLYRWLVYDISNEFHKCNDNRSETRPYMDTLMDLLHFIIHPTTCMWIWIWKQHSL